MSNSNQQQPSPWATVAHRTDLVPGAGVGALYQDQQVALFYLPDWDDSVFAVSNYCPFSGVHIIARGIIGDIKGEPVVATPLYKQHFSLRTGICVESPEVRLTRFEVRWQGDQVQVRVAEVGELAA